MHNGAASANHPRFDALRTNVCGQLNSLQIRSHVSKLGARAPDLEPAVLANSHAEQPRRLPNRPPRLLPNVLEQSGEQRHESLPNPADATVVVVG
jgi:hypothetical protein